MHRELDSGPISLDQAYATSIERINKQGLITRKLAHRLINWITFVERRISIDEICNALAVEDGEGKFDPTNITKFEQLTKICVGLVVHDQGDNTIKLVHATAYDFFRRRTSPEETHIDIARTCLNYLCLEPLAAGPCHSASKMVERTHSMQFLTYSAQHWGKHIKGRDMETTLIPLILKFLRDPNLVSSAFQALRYQQQFRGELLEA